MSKVYVTMDIETTGLNRYQDTITWIGASVAKGLKDPDPCVRTFRYADPAQRKEFVAWVKDLQLHDNPEFIWQNGKFDTLFLKIHLGLRLPVSEDVMLMGTAYDLAERHGLKEMAQRYLGVEDWDITKKQKTSTTSDLVEPYLRLDVKYTWELYKFFRQRMSAEQRKVYKKLLLPAYRLYSQIEDTGIYLNMNEYKLVQKDFARREREALAKLNVRYEINWNSSKQKADILFSKDKENLPILKVTPGGAPSADASVLKRLAHEGHDLPQTMLDYAEVNTINKMFLTRWGDDASWDGRIHPNFNLTNVVSGRTSCNNPNLQQCFAAGVEVLTPEGWVEIQTLRPGQKIAQYEKGTGNITMVTPSRILKQPYRGQLIDISGTLETRVTPDHRLLIRYRQGPHTDVWRVVTADTLPKDYCVPVGGTWRGGEAHLTAAQAWEIVKQFSAATDGKPLSPELGMYVQDGVPTWRLLQLDAASMRVLVDALETHLELSLGNNGRGYHEKDFTRAGLDVIQALYTLTKRSAKFVTDAHGALWLRPQNKSEIGTRRVTCHPVPCAGHVYCVTVPTGFILTRYRNMVSVSGNCPRNKEVRALFTAPPGRVFFEADYSQLELRIAAHYANEPTMLAIYKAGGDIHSETARIFTGGREPTKEERSKAKAVSRPMSRL